jgi:guanine nucleotide-binding protein G(i) subunit alpha
MAAISSFDQTLEEAPDVNRMIDAIQLFKSICNHPMFVNTSIILFLNKIDILKYKLTYIKLKDYFPDYEGIFYKIFFLFDFLVYLLHFLTYYIGDNKFQSVTKFFQKTFINCNENDEKHIYVHFTHATVNNIYFIQHFDI